MFTTILVQPLFNILFILYALLPGHDFGVAVIIFTILVRLALWPLVTKQLHSQRAMQRLQPEIAAVKKKAGGDRQKETAMLMELYKEKGTSPFASLLPLIVQLPILFALISVFNHSLHADQIANLTYNFTANLAQIKELSGNFDPTLFGVINLAKPNLVLAVLAGLAQFAQARQLAPKKTDDMDDQTKLMSRLTLFFPILTVVFAFNFPSALALYWMVTSLMAVFQQYWVLKRDAHEMEDQVVVTTRAEPVAKLAAPKKTTSKKKKKGSRRKGART